MTRITCVLTIFALLTNKHVAAEVTSAEEAGFQLRIVRTVHIKPTVAYANLTGKISEWWLKEHTYTGKASNLRMDFENGSFIETLPGGGFVRHMEIVFHQPGERLTLRGGLGPLQAMGLHGAMTFAARTVGEGTEITLLYNVSGYTPTGLKDLATVVNQVLEEQLDSLQRYCNEMASAELPKQ